MLSPIADLAGLTLEVPRLDRALEFYQTLFGLPLTAHDARRGTATLGIGERQTLTLWQPQTRLPLDDRLAGLHPRGAAHLHYAWQILAGDLGRCKQTLRAHGLPFEEIDLGTPGRPDPGLYFFDGFGHGLELRTVDPADPRRPATPPRPRPADEPGLPVMGLREVALAFGDYPAMLRRLPEAYGFVLAKEQDDRAFAQFPLGQFPVSQFPVSQFPPGTQPEEDGQGTPRRWLYAWDPQVGLADMMGGDHALVEFYAEVPEVLARVRRARLSHVQWEGKLAVRDPEGHTFVFRPLPE
ncbi:VOC family protein [Deinococcus sp.]|uniref:VOC family protein n=1 Tax=Deinococcus sp. TaxID=47478 RepID=UPI003C7AEAAA